MIAHLVLFRPRTSLSSRQIEGLLAAIERAHREIPSVRRFMVGKRTLLDASYAASMEDFPYLALIEVEDLQGLQQYLTHPAHADLARHFWETSDPARAYDFELFEATRAREAVGPQT